MHDRDTPFKSFFRFSSSSTLVSTRCAEGGPEKGGSGSGYLLPRCGCVRIGGGFFSEGCTFGAFVFDALTLLVRFDTFGSFVSFRFLCTVCLLFVTLLSPLARSLSSQSRNSLASTVLFILLSARNPPAFTVISILPSASDPLVPQPTLKTSLAPQPTPKASLGDTKVNKLTGNSTKPDGSNNESASPHNSQADTKDAPCTLLFKNTKGKQRRQTF